MKPYNKARRKCSEIYTVIIAILPILSVFRSPLSRFNMGTFALLLVSPIVLINSYHRHNLTVGIKVFCPYLVYICGYSVLILQRDGLVGPMVSAVYMLGICILTFSLGMKGSLNIALLRRIVEGVSLAACFVLLCQLLLFLLFRYPLRLLSQAWIYEQDSFSSELSFVAGLPRFCAFFIEPSSLSQYVIIGVASALFRGKLARAGMCSIGILLSTSGIGILLCCVAWICWYYMKLDIGKRKGFFNIIMSAFTILVVGSILFLLLLQVSFFRMAVGRIFGFGGLQNGLLGRLWSYVLFKNLSQTQQLVGVGYALTSEYYMTSIVSSLYTLGYCGTAVILITLIVTLFNTHGFYRCITILFCAMFLTALIFTQNGIAFYYSIIIPGWIRRKYQKRAIGFNKSYRAKGIDDILFVAQM